MSNWSKKVHQILYRRGFKKTGSHSGKSISFHLLCMPCQLHSFQLAVTTHMRNHLEAFKKGDICTARRMQQKSFEIVKIIIKYGGGVRGGKAIMNLIGVDCGRCRLPVTPFGDDEYSSLKRDLEKIGFLN